MTLGALFQRHGSDKYLHGYDRLYERIIKADTGSLLEVGIGTRNPDGVDHTVHEWFPADYQPGGSLRAWADWLPGAAVTGAAGGVGSVAIALLAARRATNGYADLGDLRAAAGIPDACHTDAECAARATDERDLHEALMRRRDVVCREGRYVLLTAR